MVISEDLGSCVPSWKNPSRMCGYKWDLFKVRRENSKRARWGTECAFLLQMHLKPTLTHAEGRCRRFLSNNEQVGRSKSDFQPGDGCLGHPGQPT
jgi:hypothetical protein